MLAKRWTLLETLGVGGTGTVYQAVHRNGRHVAVKVLHPELAYHSTIRKRFLSEGYAANRVRHPGAVAVLDDGEEADGTAFLVMELLEGRSLAKLLSERGALPVAEVVAAALSTLEVLAAAHDNGVVHRDVKPGNIFATLDGKIKLLDFGIAQVADLAS
ncbi:MAG TPA: serine/threonine-protein kinase, partial [Polyangiaceae bacterium]|nr:serine/threonine-protein kinase [Polyangiaceae bacterium]